MKKIDIVSAREKFIKLVDDVNKDDKPIKIVNNNGKNAVLISFSEWRNIQETFYLSSIPGFVENINYIRKNEDWDNDEVFKKSNILF